MYCKKSCVTLSYYCATANVPERRPGEEERDAVVETFFFFSVEISAPKIEKQGRGTILIKVDLSAPLQIIRFHRAVFPPDFAETNEYETIYEPGHVRGREINKLPRYCVCGSIAAK